MKAAMQCSCSMHSQSVFRLHAGFCLNQGPSGKLWLEFRVSGCRFLRSVLSSVTWCGVISGDEEMHTHNTEQLLSISVRPSCAMSGKAALLIQTLVFHLSIRSESRNYQHRPSHIPQWPRDASRVQDRQNRLRHRRPIENKELCGIRTYSYQKVSLKVLIVPSFIDFMV